MRLTMFTDYALRVLVFVALRDGRLSQISEIAHAYDISRNHLMKIVQTLGKLGYLENLRGKKGGVRLAKPPGDIRLGDLIRSTEPDFDLVECFKAPVGAGCAISGSCMLPRILDESLSLFLGNLDRYSLADIMVLRAGLSDALKLAGSQGYDSRRSRAGRGEGDQDTAQGGR